MASFPPLATGATAVGASASWTFDDLCRTCRADAALLAALVHEGVLAPTGSGPADWRFDHLALRRARAATRLSRSLRIHAEAVALVLDLRDEIDTLRARLAHR